jgi:hypothetical protein
MKEVVVVILTSETVKKLYLSTKSKIGTQAQHYFLDLEVTLYN